jgi:thioredoxin-related protein
MAVKRYALIILLLVIGIPSANAACTQKTCVDVFTDKKQLVITAQKRGGQVQRKGCAESYCNNKAGG